jgi:RluA family pseudouridine synthase
MRGIVPRPAPQTLTEAQVRTLVLYEDAHIYVLNKPAGISVHPGPNKLNDDLERYLPLLQSTFAKSPRLAHRLDRDTSGCLVLGRHDKAIKQLSQLFAAGRIEKTYWAIVEGAPPHPSGIINLPLKKVSKPERGWRIITAPDGQEAITHYQVLRQHGQRTLVEFSPKTGRTHQIRVHAAALDCPIVGDSYYGKPNEGEGLCLHARRIVIPLAAYSSGPLVIEAPEPVWSQPTSSAAATNSGFL